MSESNEEKYDVLVTGAAGFIGSHVAERLLKRGDKVLGIDDLNNYYSVSNKEKNVSILSAYGNFKFIRTDISNSSQLNKDLKEKSFNKIAHLAARAGVRPSIKDPLLYQQVNVGGTLNILEISKNQKCSNTVIASSSSVYGDSNNPPFREDDSATDRCISPYAATKKATEVLAHTYHHLYKLPITIIRPFTVYGPRGRPDMAAWLFLEAALSGKPILKFGDGSTRRDYTYIDDFVSGFVAALDNPRPFEIFNLGNSETVSLNEAIDIISKVTEKNILIDQREMQAGDVHITNADISKARELLGYNPCTSFKSGMEKFYEWYISSHSQN
ncbi:MAG TPA: GDP-mannose 4,6-dehydratase [Oligoflexia bacterium]|nr:GDP-mannose 4,6-dehydratase [Oligoflexia bacterium]